MIVAYIVAIIVGFIGLAWSADRFVIGAAGTARQLGVSPLLIGLTIVGFATSAPEMLVSAMAAYDGSPDLAVGNAIGSNIANIALILGITALYAGLPVRSSLLKREFPVLGLIMLLALVLIWDGDLSRIEGVALIVGLFILMGFLVQQGLSEKARDDAYIEEVVSEVPDEIPLGRALLWLAVGLIGLIAASRLLVWAAVELATMFGVSELVIGLTIVALGTSLPELAASIASARKGEHDLAVGNVIGSNMFNLLGVMGLAATIAPIDISRDVLVRDYPLMVGLTVALLVLSFGFGAKGEIRRFSGILLLTTYIAYQVYLISVA